MRVAETEQQTIDLKKMFGISLVRDDSAIAILRKLTYKLWLVTV